MSDIKPGKKYFSVVYEITDPALFQPAAVKIAANMAEDIVENGCKVVACGWGDYATERDALAAHVQEEGISSDDVVEDYIREEEIDVALRDITG